MKQVGGIQTPEMSRRYAERGTDGQPYRLFQLRMHFDGPIAVGGCPYFHAIRDAWLDERADAVELRCCA